MEMPARLWFIGWNLLSRAAFVGAVLLVSLTPGVSVVGALLIVSASVFAFGALRLLTFTPPEPGGLVRPAGGPRRPPGGFSGDRHPRRPSPTRPAGAIELPLPEA